MIIKNYNQLATSSARQQVLRILEAGLSAVMTDRVLAENLAYDAKADTLYVNRKAYPLKKYERVVVVGVGKVAAQAARAIEQKMLARIDGGLIIDIVPADTQKIVSRVGTHPLPSDANVAATEEIIAMLEQLSERDLVIAVISGGGSSLLTSPKIISLEEERKITQALIEAGATIIEMNTVRKHLSAVKGGQLAKYAYPATVISLIFSDIPGDDISLVASGPTVQDTSTVGDAMAIMDKYRILDRCNMDNCGMKETPKESKYFTNVHNILVCGAGIALKAMERRAYDLGLRVKIWDKAYSGEASKIAAQLLQDLEPNQCLIAAGESVVTLNQAEGHGGRNQEMALAALTQLPAGTTFAAINSDGRDNSDVAGAIVDNAAHESAQKQQLNLSAHLSQHDSYPVLLNLNASIMTGITAANISDLVVAIRE